MIIPHLAMVGLFSLPVTAHAALPPCFASLEHASQGGVLTARQNDVNNNCLRELQVASAASDLAAHIAESERKQREPASAPTSSGPFAGNVNMAPGVPPYPASARPIPALEPAASSAPSGPALPRIVMIVSNGSRYVATLRTADGNTLDCVNGTSLPDGTRVAAVTAGAVYVKQGKTLVPLGDDDDTSSPSRNQAQSTTLSPGTGMGMGRSFP